uniref:Uncharacterized protein n=1 Tax=Rhizophagus irregularis (strain DAOM 181602 / DAOM 197198 / MUCL 43194) TaxID=747089 RepID=U9TCV7_RHIID
MKAFYKLIKKNRKRKSGEAFGEDFDYIYGIQGSPQYSIFRICFEGRIGGGKDLRKNVKRVMAVIVGLLKDRLESVDEEPDRKRARIEEKISMHNYSSQK